MNTKILIVHHESQVLDLLASELMADGYEVISAATADQVSRWAGMDRPDLILVDIHRQKESGLAAYEQLRAAGFTADIPVIFVTAKQEEQPAGVDNDTFLYAAV